MRWWLSDGKQVVIGPFSTELILRGIEAGRVTSAVLVCAVGAGAWLPISDVPSFAEALRRLKPPANLAHLPVSKVVSDFDEEARTMVEHSPPSASRSLPRAAGRSERALERSTEQTMVLQMYPALPRTSTGR